MCGCLICKRFWRVIVTWLKDRALGHYDDVIMGAIASQITSLTIVYSTVYSDADQRKHRSSASVTRSFFPFDDVIMIVVPAIATRVAWTNHEWQQIIKELFIHKRFFSCYWRLYSTHIFHSTICLYRCPNISQTSNHYAKVSNLSKTTCFSGFYTISHGHVFVYTHYGFVSVGLINHSSQFKISVLHIQTRKLCNSVD